MQVSCIADKELVIGHKSDHRTWWIKGAIAIHESKRQAMNRDTGSYFLKQS